MPSKRSGLGIDELVEEESAIDLEGAMNVSKGHVPTRIIEAEIIDASEKAGFTSRQAKSKRIRPKSPYIVQNNFKTRVGVKELFQEIGAKLEVFDQETFERALLALLEKEKMKDLEKELKELLK